MTEPEEDFQCTLCLKLLFKPSTTVCGHSFCQKCLSTSLKHRAKCPICRCVLHSSPHQLAVSTEFSRLLETTFPKAYNKRRLDDDQEQLEEHAVVEEGESRLSVMVVCPVLPKQRLHLHIYEPRYRLMIQRCLEGSRRFGIMPRTFHRWYLYGTEVEIVECEPLPGGRYYLEVVGTRVFKVMSSMTTDQYLSCDVGWINLDDSLQPGNMLLANQEGGEPFQAENDNNILQMSHNLESLVDQWQALIYDGHYERSPDQLRRLSRDLGPMPPATQPGNRAFWVAALINPLPALGVAPEIRPKILRAQTVTKRLEIAQEAILQSIEYMKPNLARALTDRIVKRANTLGWFVFRHSWLILFGWWLALRFPHLLSRSSILSALKMIPPNK